MGVSAPIGERPAFASDVAPGPGESPAPEGEMQPIFIVGCQRSGTTMLGSLLGGDPATVVIPEGQFVADLAPKDAYDNLNLAAIVEQIVRHYRFGIWNFDLGGARPEGTGTYADAIRWLVARYAAAEGRTNVRFWVDHQPGHVREMQELRTHFPHLKVIHIVRDGRAVAASLMPLDWGPNAILSAANFWMNRVAFAAALRDYLGPAAWIQVRFEDVIADPEKELRRLCDFIGVPFVQNMLQGDNFKVPEFTREQHRHVGQKPDTNRAALWRDTLNRREIEIFEALAGPLLTYNGYAREFDHAARLPGFREKVQLTLQDQIRAIANTRRFRKRVNQHKLDQ